MIFKNLQIVINCLGMPFDSKTITEGTLGGSETAANCLAIELAKLGNDVKLFTRCKEPEVLPHGDGTLSYLPCGDISEDKPLGDQFHFYAAYTPHDLLIIQRHKAAFHFNYAAKMRFLWLHDLALPQDKAAIVQGSAKLDGFLVVSEYHKKQICSVYGIPETSVFVLPNGIDPQLFENLKYPELPKDKKKLIYISRPERGLENLIKPDGIMDQLPDDYELYICCYNNMTQQMAPYYEKLWRRAEEMPNVHNLGFLTKKQLYSFMAVMDLMVYPTPAKRFADFREVSCIAVMEAMASGLPVITTLKGALPETLDGAGAVFVDNIDDFPAAIKMAMEDSAKKLREKQFLAAEKKTWKKSAEALVSIIDSLFSTKAKYTSTATATQHALRHSAVSRLYDPEQFEKQIKRHQPPEDLSLLDLASFKELQQCYDFYPKPSYSEHYKTYYDYERDRGVNYGPENLEGNSRFEVVSELIGDKSFPKRTVILDYGCAHGHYTINLARRYPDLCFVGVDITHSNIIKARKWVNDEGLNNVAFYCGEVRQDAHNKETIWSWHESENLQPTSGAFHFDHFICAEVLEHVRDPEVIVNKLILASNALHPTCFITTPFGPWESQGYKLHWPWRAHIHDFTKPVINEMFGKFPRFNLSCLPNGVQPETGIPLGSYVYTCEFKQNDEVTSVYDAIKKVQHLEDFDNYSAVQSVSLCMIVKDDWQDLPRCLESVKDLVSEVVIRFDETGENTTSGQLIEQFGEQHLIPVTIIEGKSPLEIGFDNARNEAIAECSGDWILWLDADETLNKAPLIKQYLRNNLYNAYSITQNHFSNDPAGVIKTDFPAKLFRRKSGIKFFGLVHEHPEVALNEGIGPIMILPEVSISHYGYGEEATRRNRFIRNFDLLKKDRETYPERKLGKFFWLRDMAQYCQFALEEGKPRESLRWYIDQGFKIWPDILKSENYRMISESAKFYTMLVRASGQAGVLVVDHCKIASKVSDSETEIECLFRNISEAQEYLNTVNALRLKEHEEQEPL